MGTSTKKPSKYWKDAYLLEAREYSRQGLSKRSIADAIGIPWDSFRYWYKTKPVFKEAVDGGRSQRQLEGSNEKDIAKKGGETYIEFCYRRMPVALQQLWNKLEAIDKPDKHGDRPVFIADQIERLFSRTGIKHARQHLFLHALVNSNFNANEACRKVGISRTALQKWEKEPEFAELCTQIPLMKRDFAEAAVMKAVANGDSACIIFAAKCLLPETYNPTRKIDISSNQTTTNVDVGKILELLPLNHRMALLQAIQKAGGRVPAQEIEKLKQLNPPAEIIENAS